MVPSLLRRLFCRHQLSTSEKVVEGVTLSWSGNPTRQLGFRSVCRKCGKTRYEGGLYVPGDWLLHPECYGPDGWPIDPATGARLEIAGG